MKRTWTTIGAGNLAAGVRRFGDPATDARIEQIGVAR
jgi:hypothetical protein